MNPLMIDWLKEIVNDLVKYNEGYANSENETVQALHKFLAAKLSVVSEKLEEADENSDPAELFRSILGALDFSQDKGLLEKFKLSNIDTSKKINPMDILAQITIPDIETHGFIEGLLNKYNADNLLKLLDKNNPEKKLEKIVKTILSRIIGRGGSLIPKSTIINKAKKEINKNKESLGIKKDVEGKTYSDLIKNIMPELTKPLKEKINQEKIRLEEERLKQKQQEMNSVDEIFEEIENIIKKTLDGEMPYDKSTENIEPFMDKARKLNNALSEGKKELEKAKGDLNKCLETIERIMNDDQIKDVSWFINTAILDLKNHLPSILEVNTLEIIENLEKCIIKPKPKSKGLFGFFKKKPKLKETVDVEKAKDHLHSLKQLDI